MRRCESCRQDPIWNPPGLGILEPCRLSPVGSRMTVSNTIPRELAEVRVFARPPLLFYLALAGRADLLRQPDLRRLLGPGSGPVMGVARHGARQARQRRRRRARRIDSRPGPESRTCRPPLNLPTLLDVDPVGRDQSSGRRAAPLLIFACRTAGGDAMNAQPPVSLWPDPDALGTLTDLYELTMMAGYYAAGMARETASFELFVRKMPDDRAYLVFAGLEQAIGDLLRLAFSPEQIESLRGWPEFRDLDPAIMDELASLRFEGDVWSVPEGTVVFPGETLLRVTAPLPQAQWVETHLLASLAYPTLVASKAARIVTAAGGRPLYEFGARRGHGPHAGLLAARSAYLAGFAGTSHVEAARRLGIPASGTMAHSWVQSFDSEVRGVRGVRPRLPRQHDPARRHLRHARRRPSRGRDRAASPGDPDRQRRPRPPGVPGARDPRRARPTRREDHRLGRPRRIQDRRARRLGGADRRLRRRHRADHLPRRPRLGHGLQAGGARRAGESSSSAPARRPTRWPSRSSAAAIARAGSAATM